RGDDRVWGRGEQLPIFVLRGPPLYPSPPSPQTADDARDFFKRKIDFLTKQMEKIQPALQEKHAMKQAVVEMMSQKIQQLTALGAAQAAPTKA
uniref:Prefoldin subunit 5 n=1 Tax=Strix occidentalis caurina TaxID=311401 RepID=A0A8D0FU67_STROC